jgi:hypothetical protein
MSKSVLEAILAGSRTSGFSGIQPKGLIRDRGIRIDHQDSSDCGRSVLTRTIVVGNIGEEI